MLPLNRKRKKNTKFNGLMEEGRGQSLRFTQTIFNINLTAVIETDWYCSKL